MRIVFELETSEGVYDKGFLFIYNRESLELDIPDIPSVEFSNRKYLAIGSKFTYEGRKYEITDISYYISPLTAKEMPERGNFSRYSRTPPTPYNSEVRFTVKELN